MARIQDCSHGWTWSGAGYRDIPARIPGRLYTDLQACAVLMEAPNGLLHRQQEWAALRVWTLCAHLEVAQWQEERLFLRLRGLHGVGQVFLQGAPAEHFRAGDLTLEITPQNREDPVEVALVFAQQPPEGTPSRVAMGLDGAELCGINQLRIVSLQAVMRVAEEVGELELRPSLLPYVPGRYAFHYAVQWRNETISADQFYEQLPAASVQVCHRLVVPVVRKWEAGMENGLYTLCLTVRRMEEDCDRLCLRIAFRTVTFVPPSGFLRAHRQACLPVINGRRIFLQGTVWRPEIGRVLTTEERTERFVQLRRMHMQCVRVMGAECEDFYDACDARGVLVWQVLPPEPDAADALVRRIRHHACVMAYCAADRCPTAADSLRIGRLDDTHPCYDARSDGVCAKCEDDAPAQTMYAEPEKRCAYYNGDDALLRTFSCPAFCDGERLRARAGDAHAWPLSSALWDCLSEVPEGRPCQTLGAWFGAQTMEEEDRAALFARYVQAEVLRYAVERVRMRSAEAIGVWIDTMWEAGPTLYSNALLEQETMPRPAYYALESALRPLHICARLERTGFYPGTTLHAALELICETQTVGPLHVRAALYQADGTVLAEWSGDAAAKTARLHTWAVRLPEDPCALLLRLTLSRFGERLDMNDYIVCVGLSALYGALAQSANASVRMKGQSLCNQSAQIAWGVSCGAYADAVYSGFGALLPRESRVLSTKTPIEGLNLSPTGEKERGRTADA